MSTNTEANESFTEDDILLDNDNNIAEVIGQYLKHWRWIVLCVLVALALGYVYLQSQIPQYKILTTVLIKDNKGNSNNDLLQQLNLNTTDKVIDNEIDILRSSTLMRKVVTSLDLQTSYYIKKHLFKIYLYKDVPLQVRLLKPSPLSYAKDWTLEAVNSSDIQFNGKQVPLNKAVQTDAGLIIITLQPNHPLTQLSNFYVNFATVEGIAGRYVSQLGIAATSKQGTVLSISLEDAVPQRGIDVLNRLVEEYNISSIEDKNKTTANTLKFLESRLETVAADLGGVEKKVENYKSGNGITNLSSEAQLFLTGVQETDAEINRNDIQLGILNNLETYLKSTTDDQVRIPSTLGIDDPTLTGLVQQLGEAQIRREGMLRTIPKTNPLVGSVDDQIAALKQTILHTLQNLKGSLRLSKNKLQSRSQGFESTIKNVPSKERGLLDVMRQQDIKNNLFTYLLQKHEETLLSLASTVSDSRVIDKAVSSGVPIKPIRSNIYIAFLMAGIILPLLIIYLRNALNNKVKKAYDIEKITRMPVVAQIAHSDIGDPLILVAKPRSMVAEQIRSLRTNLQFLLTKPDSKVILFTSSISGEGKSFVSLNLASSLAFTGKKVIVLELDLRKPKFDSTLNLSNEVGMSNYLIGQASYQDVIQYLPQQPEVAVITSGTPPPNPAELLLNGNIDKLIEILKAEYDYVIIDAPPVGLVTDAQILAKYAHMTLFIVRYDVTKKDHIRLLGKLFTKMVFNNLNVIFNSVDTTTMGYGYGYNYGYGYYDNNKSDKKTWL